MGEGPPVFNFAPYTVRAGFELGKRRGAGTTKISNIAKAHLTKLHELFNRAQSVGADTADVTNNRLVKADCVAGTFPICDAGNRENVRKK
jgi:hypothetical protein